MSTLEDLLRETLAEQKDDAPDDAELLSVVRARAVRRHRQRRLAAGSVAVVALVAAGLAGGGLLATHRGSPSNGSPGGFARSADSTGTVSLVSTGGCAGLSVTAVFLSGDSEHPLRLAPFPAANAARMSIGDPMWLQARGPCVTRLRVYITGTGLPVTGPDGYAAFGSKGDAVIVADAEHGGHGTVGFYLDCPASEGCPPRVPPLAAITIDVSATATPAIGPTS